IGFASADRPANTWHAFQELKAARHQQPAVVEERCGGEAASIGHRRGCRPRPDAYRLSPGYDSPAVRQDCSEHHLARIVECSITGVHAAHRGTKKGISGGDDLIGDRVGSAEDAAASGRQGGREDHAALIVDCLTRGEPAIDATGDGNGGERSAATREYALTSRR